jgi:hypothetical protein
MNMKLLRDEILEKDMIGVAVQEQERGSISYMGRRTPAANNSKSRHNINGCNHV